MTRTLRPKNVILYADDDEDDLMLMKESFACYSEDIEMVTARDGFEALSYLRNLPSRLPGPCLVILDINMPRKNGKEVLLELRQIRGFENVPAVLFTTSSQPHDREFAEKYKAGFVTKPIDARQMAYIVDTFIEHCTEEVKKNLRRKP